MDAEYIQSEAVKIIRSMSRFGHGKDITQILSTDKYEQLDYVYGITKMITILFVGLVAWLLLLVTLKCLGPTRVGFLSGGRFFDPEAENGESPIPCYRPNLVRANFLLFSVCLLCFCGILVTKGSLHYDDTITFFQSSVSELSDLMADSYSVATFLIGVGLDAAGIRDKAVVSLDDFCPDGDAEQLFNSKVDPKDVVADISELSDFTVNRSREVRSEINDFQLVLEEADGVLGEALTYKGYSLHIVLPIAALTSILVAGTLLASSGFTNSCLENIQSWMVMPLLLLISIVFWIGTIFFVIVSLVNADLCSGGNAPGSPDDTIIEVMNRFDIQEKSPDIYNIIEHYVKGCRTPDPFGFLEQYEVQLQDALVTVDQFLTGLEEVNITFIESSCGKPLDDDVRIVEDLSDLLIRLDEKTGDMMDLIDCQRINKIYTLSVHNGTCNSLVPASGWIALSLFFISFSGMLLVTLRSSWLGTAIYDEDEDMELDVDSFVKHRDNSVYDQSITSDTHYSPSNMRSPQSALSYGDGNTYDEYPTPEQPQSYERDNRRCSEDEIEEMPSSRSWEHAQTDVVSHSEVLPPEIHDTPVSSASSESSSHR